MSNLEYSNFNLNKDTEEKNDELLNITRNNLNPINIRNNNVFPFLSKKLLNQIDPSYLSNQQKTIIRNRHIHFSSQKREKEDILNTIKKYEEEIKNKKYLLKISQQKSNKFNQKEKNEIKKLQMYLNKYDTKEIYNDISNIFSKEPNKKYSILDKFTKKTEDNVLDPKIYSLKRQINLGKLNSFLPKSNKTTEESTIINSRNNTKTILEMRNKNMLTSPKSETVNNSSNINSHIKLKKKILLRIYLGV